MKKKRRRKKEPLSANEYLRRQAEQVAALCKKKHPEADVQIKTYPEEDVTPSSPALRTE